MNNRTDFENASSIPIEQFRNISTISIYNVNISKDGKPNQSVDKLDQHTLKRLSQRAKKLLIKVQLFRPKNVLKMSQGNKFERWPKKKIVVDSFNGINIVRFIQLLINFRSFGFLWQKKFNSKKTNFSN